MIVVYTAMFAENGRQYDNMVEPELVVRDGSVEYYYFTNCQMSSDVWKIIDIENNNLSGRRASRWIKTHPFILFPDADFVLWHGGNVSLKIDPHDLLKFLGDNDTAILKHPIRDCVYKEFGWCGALDVGKIINAQKVRYQAEGYPENNGLVAANLVLRKNSSEARKLSRAWWDEVVLGSHRDQLSFNYTSWKTGISFSTISYVGDFVDNDIYEKGPHRSRKLG